MVQIAVKLENDEEWVMVELQGTLQNKEETGLEDVHIGDLHFDQMGTPHLIIGHHLLVGSVSKLDKSFAVLEKSVKPIERDELMETDDYEDGEKHETSYNVVALIKKKIIFKTRPRPIITKVMPIVK